jgi:hypothetical protein
MPEIGPEQWADGPRAARRPAGRTDEGGRPMDKQSSWTRIAITFAIDWRFVMTIVILVVLVLLMK